MTTLEEVRLPMITEKINKNFSSIDCPVNSYYGINLENFDKETLIKIIAVENKRLSQPFQRLGKDIENLVTFVYDRPKGFVDITCPGINITRPF